MLVHRAAGDCLRKASLVDRTRAFVAEPFPVEVRVWVVEVRVGSAPDSSEGNGGCDTTASLAIPVPLPHCHFSLFRQTVGFAC